MMDVEPWVSQAKLNGLVPSEYTMTGSLEAVYTVSPSHNFHVSISHGITGPPSVLALSPCLREHQAVQAAGPTGGQPLDL